MKSTILLFFSLFYSCWVFAQKDKIERIWYNEEKTSKIEIFKGSDGIFYGKIVWLVRPSDEKGKNKLDKLNPDDKLKNRTIVNSMYINGTVYSPANGKTYCGTIQHRGKELKLRGYFCGFSIIGKSWTCPLAE